MLSTRLTTIDNGILSHNDLMNMIRGAQTLIERRTANDKIFGKLEITIPNVTSPHSDDTGTPAAEPRNLIAGFLLDTSGSMMEGEKLKLAINTIKKFMDVLHAEREGNTIKHQPFHAWIYVITFNSVAELVIPYQEITAESMLLINERLDHIRATGCTNYERAFMKQTEVIEDILRKIKDPNQESLEGGQNPRGTPQQYHLIRFFETDGEITEGSKNAKLLYEMMRRTETVAEAAAAAAADRGPRITFEDYVIGYGKDVDLGCLKELASPYHPEGAAAAAAAAIAAITTSLVTILNTEDIGFKAGEILFKLILRCGNNWEISVETSNGAKVELFEYQTHQWGAETTIHSMIHGEKRPLWIQYTPPPPSPATTGLFLPPIQVTIKYENQFTAEKFTYKFEHEIVSEQQQEQAVAATAADRVTTVVSMINGMAQIEIFKMFREIEADRYDKDTIVREAYKIMRILKSINAVTSISYPAIACQTQNLITDVKVIIGLTTIQDEKEQKMVIHDRRICSAEQEVFNSGASISRMYITDEEEYEEEAIRVINAAKTANPEQQHQYQEAYEEFSDALPSRIATAQPLTIHTSPDDYVDTPFIGGGGGGRRYNHNSGSELRALCVRIAVARNKKEDTTAEELYQQMHTQRYSGLYDPEEYIPVGGDRDDTFSSTPMDDVYSQCRIGIMRQMSSS